MADDNTREKTPRVPGYVRDIADAAKSAPRTPGYVRDISDWWASRRANQRSGTTQRTKTPSRGGRSRS